MLHFGSKKTGTISTIFEDLLRNSVFFRTKETLHVYHSLRHPPKARMLVGSSGSVAAFPTEFTAIPTYLVSVESSSTTSYVGFGGASCLLSVLSLIHFFFIIIIVHYDEYFYFDPFFFFYYYCSLWWVFLFWSIFIISIKEWVKGEKRIR